ncbi:50S ribosomal protein L23 [Patescibacteria group bacterium]
MKVKPVITEKSLSDAKEGYYTFLVDKRLTKYQIRKIISDLFGVNVVRVRTLNYKAGEKRNYLGKSIKVKAKKKAIVTLKDKEKIDLFDEKKK